MALSVSYPDPQRLDEFFPPATHLKKFVEPLGPGYRYELQETLRDNTIYTTSLWQPVCSGIARQVAEDIAQCNSATKLLEPDKSLSLSTLCPRLLQHIFFSVVQKKSLIFYKHFYQHSLIVDKQSSARVTRSIKSVISSPSNQSKNN